MFLHVLPDLSAHSQDLAELMATRAVVAESIIYALSLAGLAAFYGLERKVKLSRANSRRKGQGDQIEENVLWLHVASYAVFNLLIGYLLLASRGGRCLVAGALFRRHEPAFPHRRLWYAQGPSGGL